MYGWRARIGHVAPSRGDPVVYEFYKMFPEGVMMLNTTGSVRQLVGGDFEKQLSRIEEAVQSTTIATRLFQRLAAFHPLALRRRPRPRQEIIRQIRRPRRRWVDRGSRSVESDELPEARRRHALRGRD